MPVKDPSEPQPLDEWVRSQHETRDRQSSTVGRVFRFASEALAYFWRGWFAMPCCRPTRDGLCACGHHPPHTGRDIGKAPLLATFKSYFAVPPTTADILRWGRRYPVANLGILLEPSRLLVIDTDSTDALAEATMLGLPLAPSVASGKGNHFYYARPANAPITRRTQAGASQKLDILTAGYVVAPPSRHVTGRPYQWNSSPETCPLAEAPAWAVEMLRAVGGHTHHAAATRVTQPGVPPVKLPSELPVVSLQSLGVSRRVITMILAGSDPRHPSLSETRYAVIHALVATGWTDEIIASILLDARHGISGPLRGRGLDFVAGEIRRAREKTVTLVGRPS